MIKTVTNDKHSQSISPEDAKIISKLLTSPLTCWHILHQSDFVSICRLRHISRTFYNCSTQCLDGYECSPLAKRSIACYNFQGFLFEDPCFGLSRGMQSKEMRTWCSANSIAMPGVIKFFDHRIEAYRSQISENMTNESNVLLVGDGQLKALRNLIADPASAALFNIITKLIIACHDKNDPNIIINSLLATISQNTNTFCKLSSLEIRVESAPFEFTAQCPIFKTITLASIYVGRSASFILSGPLFEQLKTINIGIECDAQLKDPFDNLTTINIGLHAEDPKKYNKPTDKPCIYSDSFNGEIKFEPTLEGRSHGYVTRVSRENNLAEIQDHHKQEYIKPTNELYDIKPTDESCGKFLILLLFFMLGLTCLRSYLHGEKSR